MVNPETAHTATRIGRQSLERPARHRPTGRPDQHRPEARQINEVLVDLANSRQRYEDLRNSGAAMDERARLISMLHRLRAEAALARDY